MTNPYLGEFPYEGTKSPEEWALYFIMLYGGIDGAHHKDWVLDQVARILHGTPVIATVAKWGPSILEVITADLRVRTGEPSQEYLDWVTELKSGEEGPDTYGYDEGIAP